MGCTEQETARNEAFKACPIFKSYLATALEDCQFSENEDACEDEREARDCGTIYDCPQETFDRAQSDCIAFMSANGRWIQRALDLEPGEDGLRYGRDHFTHDRIGYYFYMTRVGHGVGFTDDGDDMALQIMADYSRVRPWCEGLYIGDDGKAYWY